MVEEIAQRTLTFVYEISGVSVVIPLLHLVPEPLNFDIESYLTEVMNSMYPVASVTDFPTICCNDICSICLELMELGKEMRCKHVFHETCLQEWLVQRRTCPICRGQV